MNTANASTADSQPPPMCGMEGINRYWDRTNHVWAVKILPGELYVTAHGEMVVTVLGSCVAACIRDKSTGVGGMNHFLLPTEMQHSVVADADGGLRTRFGSRAMDVLIAEILKHGSSKKNLELKLFGGANIAHGMDTDIGEFNIRFVRRYLQEAQISIAAEDVGGLRPRKVYYNPVTGYCRVRFFDRLNNSTLADREEAYTRRVARLTAGSQGALKIGIH